MEMIENIIEEHFVRPLMKIFSGEEAPVGWNLRKKAEDWNCCLHDSYWKKIFHHAMTPIYRRLLSGNYSEEVDRGEVLFPIAQWMYSYDGLDKLVGEHNILDVLNSAYYKWKGSYEFFRLLHSIMAQSYRPYIQQWPEDTINEEIEKLEVNGDSVRGELLCIMSAYLMIEHTDLSESHKDFLEKQLDKNWSYLTHVYSFMVRRIVGSNFKGFLQIINNVAISPSCHSYVHIFHKVVLMRRDEFFDTSKKKEKLAKHMARLEDIMKTTPQKDDLDELCNIIFGADFEEMMKNRFMSYDELNEKANQLQDSVEKLATEMKKVTEQFAEAVESRVSVEVIEKQLLRMAPSMASTIFGNLCFILAKDPAWIKIQAELSEKIIQKSEPEPSVINCGAYYAKGANHEDHGRQLYLTTGNDASNKEMLDSKNDKK